MGGLANTRVYLKAGAQGEMRERESWLILVKIKEE
jgi:hypothetical protein